jgi:hypothetical protein
MAISQRLAALEPRQLRHEGPPSHRYFFGHGVYGPEGRRVAVLRISRTGRPGSNQPYAIVELAGYAPNGGEMRAVPLSRLSYEKDREILICDLPEMKLRSAPSYTGPADWLDSRWTRRLDDYFDALGSR